MRFYAISTEAIQHTTRALEQLEPRRKGSARGSRALRVAQLYGHLQLRARGGGSVVLGLRELAMAWSLQPRDLRTDLRDLQALGWLQYRSTTKGVWVQLADPHLEVDPREAPVTQAQVLNDASDVPASQLVTALQPTPPEPLEEPEPSGGVASSQLDDGLIARFTETYNRYRPSSWPTYSPRGGALAARLRRAIRHAGNEEALLARLAQALGAMPEFWRTTYPQGRSGADCITALLSADRKAAGLGVEFWHLFSWGSQGQTPGSAGTASQRTFDGIGGNTAAVGTGCMAATLHPDHRRACELLAWDGHAWQGRGMAAAQLPASEKQHLAEVLEAAGFGKPGQAAEQFAQTSRC